MVCFNLEYFKRQDSAPLNSGRYTAEGIVMSCSTKFGYFRPGTIMIPKPQTFYLTHSMVPGNDTPNRAKMSIQRTFNKNMRVYVVYVGLLTLTKRMHDVLLDIVIDRLKQGIDLLMH